MKLISAIAGWLRFATSSPSRPPDLAVARRLGRDPVRLEKVFFASDSVRPISKALPDFAKAHRVEVQSQRRFAIAPGGV
jgi:hypothetical protein